MAKCPATQLTIRHLKTEGWTQIAVVEKWNPHARIRQDLYGIIDVLAIRPGETLAVQTTSAANVSARMHKIAESPTIGDIREAGWTIHVHGWKKIKNRWVLHRNIDVS